ncbi:MarR family transcriptional regulator [Nocardiaceae bacterium YC2-7]|uniref:MarR family transcriptional regulator n=1 Tax=Antrihabitans stalactiti TaxID=2584121 RepID=A0A848KM06_9NOCA|nr:MarR family transcriptional regulator [Antrihabitans stalactiti]NMN98958.1 MarR family transcriptional regulator [Antrihabitans stalactiti]
MGAVTDESPPLARLFAIAFRTLIDGLHERLAARGWHDVKPTFGFVLLAAREAGIQSSEVAALLGISKQAASKIVDAMVEADYVSRSPHPDDQRAKIVTLTVRGAQLLDDVEQIYAELESEWATIVGGAQIEGMRENLVTVLLATHGGRLPQVRAT